MGTYGPHPGSESGGNRPLTHSRLGYDYRSLAPLEAHDLAGTVAGLSGDADVVVDRRDRRGRATAGEFADYCYHVKASTPTCLTCLAFLPDDRPAGPCLGARSHLAQGADGSLRTVQPTYQR